MQTLGSGCWTSPKRMEGVEFVPKAEVVEQRALEGHLTPAI